LISISNLSYRYRHSSRPALDSITLDIPRGSTFGLLGPNGAGKTTLLSILTGVRAPQSGSISVAGRKLTRDAAAIKSLSAYVPQDYAFYLALSGRENLRFFAGVYGLSSAQRREQLQYCVDVCGLQELLDERTAEYSGGMKRRLNLAIGLLNAPQILYLDEPTVGIDVLSRQVIVEALKILRTRGTTIVYTSHYMEEVEAICDEIAVINHGRLAARDTTANLLQQGQRKTLLLSLSGTPDEDALQALATWSPRPVRERQIELSVGDAAELEQIIAVCRQQQLQIEQAQFGVSRLERIYLSLLQGAATGHERVT
jgi:ABC-2 type transport system ATP-binding protein